MHIISIAHDGTNDWQLVFDTSTFHYNHTLTPRQSFKLFYTQLKRVCFPANFYFLSRPREYSTDISTA
ncbi:hypothetical protein UF16_20440 [Chromobacterium violaceum]|nr:hypothetical protein UF16_20440 [Chromobacterium violaceum]